MMMSDKGPVIGIFHNYALCRRQTQSIHSKIQLQEAGGIVDDTSKHFKGTQTFTLASDHRVPMQLSAGLPYIEMRLVTKEELENPKIAQVICSQDDNWNPRQFDDELSHKNLIERMPPPKDDDSNEDEHFILDNGDIDIDRLRNNKATVKASNITKTNNSPNKVNIIPYDINIATKTSRTNKATNITTERSDEVDTKIFYDTLDWRTIDDDAFCDSDEDIFYDSKDDSSPDSNKPN